MATFETKYGIGQEVCRKDSRIRHAVYRVTIGGLWLDGGVSSENLTTTYEIIPLDNNKFGGGTAEEHELFTADVWRANRIAALTAELDKLKAEGG